MPIGSERFRDALRLFASGVTLLTVRSPDGSTHGLTVSAFASVSPDPPLITVIVDQRHHGHALLERPGTVFAVNILGEAQAGLANRFAWTVDEDRFAEGSWLAGPNGAPILADALAWLACSLHSKLHAGSHTLYVGLVEHSGTPRPDALPLLYWNRGYRRVYDPA